MEATGTKKMFSWDVEVWILSYDTSRNYRAFLTTADPAKIWAEVRKGRTAIGPDDAISIIRFENYSQMNVVNDDAANAWIIKTMSGPPPEPPPDTNIAPPVKWADAP
jgi:hypothetical protein